MDKKKKISGASDLCMAFNAMDKKELGYILPIIYEDEKGHLWVKA